MADGDVTDMVWTLPAGFRPAAPGPAGQVIATFTPGAAGRYEAAVKHTPDGAITNVVWRGPLQEAPMTSKTEQIRELREQVRLLPKGHDAHLAATVAAQEAAAECERRNRVQAGLITDGARKRSDLERRLRVAEDAEARVMRGYSEQQGTIDRLLADKMALQAQVADLERRNANQAERLACDGPCPQPEDVVVRHQPTLDSPWHPGAEHSCPSCHAARPYLGCSACKALPAGAGARCHLCYVRREELRRQCALACEEQLRDCCHSRACRRCSPTCPAVQVLA